MKPYNISVLTPSAEAKSANRAIQERVAIPDRTFTIVPPRAGASDALGRTALAYDVVTTHFDIRFRYEPYSNYHSPDLDFYSAFGVYDSFELCPNARNSQVSQTINLSFIVQLLLEGRPPFERPGPIRILPDLNKNDEAIRRLRREKGLAETFYSKLSYRPATNPFSKVEGRLKVVVHLRRQDISGVDLFRGIPLGLIPSKQRRGIHHRPLLYLDTAIEILRGELESDSDIELIIASDGTDRLRSRFRNISGVMDNIDRIDRALRAQPPVNSLPIRSVKRLIGAGHDITVETMDAMFLADLVLTSSSSFPLLPCRFGGTPVVVVSFNPE